MRKNQTHHKFYYNTPWHNFK